ncbi:dihydrolipoyl dehydrogenase [Sinimarinibacterium sp. CAU 1509]|uniref:dihydrolipoyl dehydrogenase n=1 Tax=Sinimarinibacterium sp. CAU 1509 TaxID=2562283 RepID=UPI0010AC91C2|nr:dihydrolipoyl dehydrogenase [Sinimarinibacterium sp. CAU 1509]TJY60841.1 dihydrolipoyl dehydrogenase [Sinimarinibacterium sp. CAU 1509]
MSEQFDVVVIGGGPGGYPCAIRAAQLGFKTACIDGWLNRDSSTAFGGTCLNAGCIPSKALLESSELYHRMQHEASAHGIGVGKLAIDLEKMQARKQTVSRQLTGGIKTLFTANKVTGLHGYGKLLGGGQVEFTAHDGAKQTLSAKYIVIATGSEPVNLKIAAFDGERIVDSWGALDFTEVPKSLGIIGAGVIGVELGSVWSRLGAKTVILEALPTFLPMVDAQISKEALRHLTKQGLDIRLGAKVQSAKAGAKGVVVEYESGGEIKKETFDKLIVAVGRKPYTSGLGAEELGVALDERGFVKVDAHYKTNIDGVYAVGDVIGGAMLAHKGIEEGVALAEQLAGHHTQVNYNAIPSVVYTAPEIAWVGLTEEQAKAKGYEVKTGMGSFAPSGRAKAMEQAAGSIKVIADVKTDRILGFHMCGPYVSELLAEAVLALEFAATCEDLALTMHGHPTLSETLHDAVLAVDGRAVHAINKPKK